MTSFNVTDNAAKRIGFILGKESGGGCSGFSYKFDLVEESEADDIVIEKAGAKVLVDPVSLEYMDGSELDFIDNLMGQSFQIKNPLATASCGCGTSFSL